MKRQRPVSERAANQPPIGCMVVAVVVFGLVFALGGAGFTVMLASGVLEQHDLEGWEPTPCRIVESRLTRDAEGGRTAHVRYAYVRDGVSFESQRVSFVSAGDADSVVARYPVGSEATCYVDWDDPAAAVLDRTASPWRWFILLVPLSFVAAGLWMILFLPRVVRRKLGDVRLEIANPVARAPRRSAGRGCGFAFVTAFGVLWNGVVVAAFAGGGWSWFLLPFVLIGLGIIAAWVYTGLSLLNPRLTVTLTPDSVAPGEAFRVRWEVASGRVSSLRSLEVVVIGCERATYARGTNTHTATHEFHREAVFRTEARGAFATGDVEAAIPLGAMHSFSSPRNVIEWKVLVHGDIPRWPDITEEAALLVAPSGSEPDAETTRE